ncbi:hypothetical protein DFP72DRAFT_50859 [Ephemerocybe angulata]|uniref:Uncharacterized protein n=1 Tax=Ephemerocybe angulata TaxID=980116 RepID=A0A8H6HE47_9AGAR|nr:hypothetical protein DFP72DRAFT_50859 [Tulosesus angulatus]
MIIADTSCCSTCLSVRPLSIYLSSAVYDIERSQSPFFYTANCHSTVQRFEVLLPPLRCSLPLSSIAPSSAYIRIHTYILTLFFLSISLVRCFFTIWSVAPSARRLSTSLVFTLLLGKPLAPATCPPMLQYARPFVVTSYNPALSCTVLSCLALAFNLRPCMMTVLYVL